MGHHLRHLHPFHPRGCRAVCFPFPTFSIHIWSASPPPRRAFFHLDEAICIEASREQRINSSNSTMKQARRTWVARDVGTGNVSLRIAVGVLGGDVGLWVCMFFHSGCTGRDKRAHCAVRLGGCDVCFPCQFLPRFVDAPVA